MKPAYQVRIWQEDGWWLARVMAASDGGDTSPLNALTQARSLAKIESMARDLIATVLDSDEDAFDLQFEYQLPGNSGDLVCQARGARAFLDAAQDLWQERSATAAMALAEEGYSLRETATLLGLSHQRVDQILGSRHADRKQSNVIVICEGASDAAWLRHAMPAAARANFAAILVLGAGSIGSSVISHGAQLDAKITSRFRALLHEATSLTDESHDDDELQDCATRE